MASYHDFINAIKSNASRLGHDVAHFDETKAGKFFANTGAGITRSLEGTAQGVSGLYDLFTPGKGTNRFSKKLDNSAKQIDEFVSDNPAYSNRVYKGSQAATDVAQFFTGGTEVKAVAELPNAATKATKIASFLDSATPEVLKNGKKAVEKTAEKLSRGNVVERATSKSIRGITDPKTQAGIGVFTALQTGANASKGRDTSPTEVAKNLAMNELFAGAAPAAGEVISTGVKKTASAVKGIIDNAPAARAAEEASGLPKTSIVDNHDASHINDFAHSDSKEPTSLVRTIAERLGLDPADKEGFKSYLNKRNTFLDTHTAVAQGGYVGGRPETPGAKLVDDVAPTEPALANTPGAAAVRDTPDANGIDPLQGADHLPEGNPARGVTPVAPDAPVVLPDGTPRSLDGTVQTTDVAPVSAPKNVETVTTPSIPNGSYGEATDELLGRTKFGHQAKKEAEKTNGTGVKDRLKKQFYDKFSKINDMVRTIEDATGKKIRTEDDPYALMRLYQGMPDAVQQKVQGITDVLKQAPDINSVKAIGMARQIISRGERGISSTITPERARQVIAEQRAKLGDEGFQRAADAVDAVQQYHKGMLDDLRQEGIISKAAYDAITEQGGDYFSKLNVLDKLLENNQNRALFSSGGSYNTTKQSITRVLAEAKGHEKGSQLLDPIESLVQGTDANMRLIAKNRIYNAFDRLKARSDGLVVDVRRPENVAEKIDLATDNAGMRPIRLRLEKLIKNASRTTRTLQTQINQLEKKGLNLSLKNGSERMTNQEFEVTGLGGSVPTSQAGRAVVTTPGEKGVYQALGDVIPTNPDKLGPSDTKKFLTNLIENNSKADIDRIKKAVGNRDAKVTKLLNILSVMKGDFEDVATQVRANSQRTRELADAEIPDGYAVISGYKDGIQGKLAVPKEVADVFTGKTPGQQDYLTSVMSKVNGFVKQNLTSNNPAFALVTNPLRDAKSFAYNARDVKSNPVSIGAALAKGFIARALPDSINPYTELVDRWIAAGGKSGFYADERSGEKIAKAISLEVNGKRSLASLGVKVNEVHSAQDFIREAGRVITAPARVVRDRLHGAASVLEDAPRVAQFLASVKGGASDAEAALNARNVTVDFSQSGRIGQTINAWVPFLNARGQGTIKSIQAIKRNPARAAAVYAGVTAAPIALAAYFNEQHKDVLKMIPDQDRDNNFIIVLNDHKDADGNYTGVIKIPKSDVDKTLGNPLEMVFRKMADDNPDNLQAVITNMVGSVLPVDTVKDDKFNTSRAVGGVLPAVVKAPIESATNHNLYFDSDLVSQSKKDLPEDEQINPNTSTVGKFLGAVTGTSPIKADNTIRNFTGSLLTTKPQDQLGGNLVGAKASRMNTEFYKVLEDTKKERASISNQINQAITEGDVDIAQRLATQYNQYLAKKFTPFVKQYRSNLTQDLVDLYDKQPLTLTRRSIKSRQRNALERQAAQ